MDDQRFQFIWCSNCCSVQPLERDDTADDRNVYAGRVLICTTCRTIVATLHEHPHATEPLREQLSLWRETAATQARRTTRVTSEPDTPPPQMVCPACNLPLVYRQTVLGGVTPRERWDYFDCRTCGPFVYRYRTRQLRSAM